MPLVINEVKTPGSPRHVSISCLDNAKTSLLKFCSSILESSNKWCFLSVFGFQKPSRKNCYKLPLKATEEEEKNRSSCYWMLQQWQFDQNWMAFITLKDEQRARLKDFPGGVFTLLLIRFSRSSVEHRGPRGRDAQLVPPNAPGKSPELQLPD